MTKRTIPIRKRFALFEAHNRKCAYCGVPLRFGDMCVDHVVPQKLSASPGRLEKLKTDLELGVDFVIDDYCNWLPTCPKCNLGKGGDLREPSELRFFLARAKEKSGKAMQEEERHVKGIKSDDLLAQLAAALGQGDIAVPAVLAVLADLPEPERRTHEPIVVCFGLAIKRVLESGLLPSSVSTYYPLLCDWLEKDLTRKLDAVVSSAFTYSEASLRTGETLSVRVASQELDFDELDLFEDPWWEILEIAYYSEIYGTSFAD